MLLDLIPALLLGLAMLAGGSVLLAGWSDPSPGERLVLAWALGAGLLGTLTLLVGLWRFDRWTLGAIDGVLLIVGARPLWRLARSLVPAARDAAREIAALPLRRVLFAALLLFAVLDLLGAATVVIDGDALRYHLAVPQRWLRLGAIGATPGIPFASFPLLVQLSYAHALAWGFQATPALLHTGWALMLAVGVAIWTRRSWDAGVALLAALLLLSLTDVSAEAKQPRIDLAVALYSWGAASSWLRWRSGDGRGWLVCAAALAGCAAASKYTGLIPLVVIGVLLLLDWVRRRVRLGDLLRFGAIAALIAAPWYLKNWLLSGNPVFPFGAALFGGALPLEVLARIAAENSGYAPIPRTPLYFLLAPLLLTFDNQRFASGRIGPLWLMFLPLWFWYRPKPGWSRAALAWGLLFAPLWFWTSPLVRFGLPILALWSPILAAVLVRCAERGAWVRWAVIGITGAWIGFAMLSSARHTITELPVALGLRTPQSALAAATPLDGAYTYADLRRAAEAGGPLVVFDTAGFYLDRPVTLAGDLGSQPAALLEQRYGGARCGVVYVLLPNQVPLGLDAWVADRVRPWMQQHAAQEIYRRGPVALYKVDGCAKL